MWLERSGIMLSEFPRIHSSISGSDSTGLTVRGREKIIPDWGFLWCSGLQRHTEEVCQWRAGRGKEVCLHSAFRSEKEKKNKNCKFFNFSNVILIFLPYIHINENKIL